jgi:multidrug efflux pump subunit AcrB
MSFPNLSALAVRERPVTLFFLLLSLAAGAYAFWSLGRAEDPAFTVRVVVVSALWPGATAPEMVEQVAERLEKRLQEVPYFYKAETTARPGRVDIVVEFQDYTPNRLLPELFYQVRKRMQDEAAHLPAGVWGPVVNDDFADVYFSLLALTAPGLAPRELVRQAEAVRDRLARVPGVRKAVVLGERLERVFVEFDLPRLTALGLSPPAVFDAIEAYNRRLPAGLIETAGPRLYLRPDADLADLDKLRAVPLRVGDRLVRLDEIATVRHGYEEPPSYRVRFLGEEALLLGVVMAEGENGQTLGRRLREFLAAEQAQLPLGLKLQPFTNQAEAIAQAVNLFQVKFFVAVGVVMLVTLLALGWRAGLVVGITVPITLGLTFLLMQWTGVNLDRITLGALIIALGLLVDDAMIALELMIVKLEEGWERTLAASHAWTVTAAPMLFGTLVTVSGFLPIGFARSGVGEYAGNIFWVLAYALVISWFVAVLFTPYLGVTLLPRYPVRAHTDTELYQTLFYRRFRRLVRGCLRRRWWVITGTAALLALALAGLLGPVQKQFFPGSDRPEVLVSLWLPQGSSVAATDAVARRMEAELAGMPEVRHYATFVGAGAPRFFISANPEMPDPAFAKIVAIARDARARDRVMARLEARVRAGAFPEARVRVHRLLYGPPVPWPVGIRVHGPELAELRRIARQVRAVMEAHPHTHGTRLEWDERAPVWRLRTDPERLRRLGLTPRDLAQQLQFLLDGVPVTQLRQDIRTVEVRARGVGPRPRAEDLLRLELKTAEGRAVPLAHVATLEVSYEEPVLRRYNREPFLAVEADVRDAQPPDVAADLWRQLAEVRKTLPPGYRLEEAGTVEQSAKANASIQKLVPAMLALMLVFIMLQMRVFSGMLTTLATAPLGLIGAVAALLLARQPFGFVALLGLIGLGGILMRNTLILTQQVRDNTEAGMDIEEAIVEAVVRRARPVVLTAAAAMLAFVPLTTDSFWGPLAYVLIGGCASGTVITLLAVPALYARGFQLPEPPDETDSSAPALPR